MRKIKFQTWMDVNEDFEEWTHPNNDQLWVDDKNGKKLYTLCTEREGKLAYYRLSFAEFCAFRLDSAWRKTEL